MVHSSLLTRESWIGTSIDRLPTIEILDGVNNVGQNLVHRFYQRYLSQRDNIDSPVAYPQLILEHVEDKWTFRLEYYDPGTIDVDPNYSHSFIISEDDTLHLVTILTDNDVELYDVEGSILN